MTMHIKLHKQASLPFVVTFIIQLQIICGTIILFQFFFILETGRMKILPPAKYL